MANGKVEWLVGSVLIPLILVLIPMFQGTSLYSSLKSGEMLVYAFSAMSSVLLSGIFRQHQSGTSTAIVLHIISSLIFCIVLVLAYGTRFEDGKPQSLQANGVALSVAAAGVAVLLGALRPTKVTAQLKPKVTRKTTK